MTDVPVLKEARHIPVERCDTCAEIADRAFEGGTQDFQEVAVAFLNHVIEKHTGELLALLGERYGPVFLAKRRMR